MVRRIPLDRNSETETALQRKVLRTCLPKCAHRPLPSTEVSAVETRSFWSRKTSDVIVFYPQFHLFVHRIRSTRRLDLHSTQDIHLELLDRSWKFEFVKEV